MILLAMYRSLSIVALAGILLSGGCARYEYEVVEPADLAQRIGSKLPVTLNVEPIRYEAISSSDRLVLLVHNDSEQPLKLLGEDSFAVDPAGESHPMPTRTIAPQSSTRLIFPPVRPTLRSSNSGLSVGVGVGYSNAGRRAYGRGGFAGDPYFYDNYPRYYRLEDDGVVYWNWSGDGTLVKVRLVYQLADKRFPHDFTFRRVKA
jgi:hypothetical protein